MANEEPPFLTVGTEVSAKFRGAFCEATIQSVKKLVKCKVSLPDSCCIVNHDAIEGELKLNGAVKVSSPDGELKKGVIIKLTDHSSYTVVFDDGDERTLRRTSLCLKGGRHFQEDETLDHLPLTDPENFGTPVLRTAERRTRRKSVDDEDSIDEDPPARGRSKRIESTSFLGKVVCVECGERKKTWFPALCLRRDMADHGMVVGKDQILIQSFKDGKRLCVHQNDIKQFSKEKEPVLSCVKGDTKIEPILRGAVEKALAYYDYGELPKGWNLDVVGLQDRKEQTNTDGDEDTSDDEENAFLTRLNKFLDDQGTPMARAPVLGSHEVNLHKLFNLVKDLGGMDQVTSMSKWRSIYSQLGMPTLPPTAAYNLKNVYKKYLSLYEEHENEIFEAIEASKSKDNSKSKQDESEKKSNKTDSDSETEKRRPRSSRPRSRRKSCDKPGNNHNNSTNHNPDRRRSKNNTPEQELHSTAMNDNNEDHEPVSKPTDALADYMVDVVNSPQSSILSETDSKDFSDVKSECDISCADAGKYSVGSRILVKYGRGRNQKSYEAKIVEFDSEVKEDIMYFVHYTGWNTRYDEWIKVERILGLSVNPTGRKRSNHQTKASREKPKEKLKEKEKEKEDPKPEMPSPEEPVPINPQPLPPPPPPQQQITPLNVLPPPVSKSPRVLSRPAPSRSPPVITAERIVKQPTIEVKQAKIVEPNTAADAKPSPVKPRTTRNSMQDAFLWSALEESIGRPHPKVKTETSIAEEDETDVDPPRAKKTRSSTSQLPGTNNRGKMPSKRRSDEEEEDIDQKDSKDSISSEEKGECQEVKAPSFDNLPNSVPPSSYRETDVQKWIEDSKKAVVEDFTAKANRNPRSKASPSDNGANTTNTNGRTRSSTNGNGRYSNTRRSKVMDDGKHDVEMADDAAKVEKTEETMLESMNIAQPTHLTTETAIKDADDIEGSSDSDKDSNHLMICQNDDDDDDGEASPVTQDEDTNDDEMKHIHRDELDDKDDSSSQVSDQNETKQCDEPQTKPSNYTTEENDKVNSPLPTSPEKEKKPRHKKERREKHKRSRSKTLSSGISNAGGDEVTSENEDSPQASPKKRKETCVSPPYKSDLDFLSDLGDLASMEGPERIKIMQARLCEMKKTYCKLKAEVASIDRRRRRKMKKRIEATSNMKEQAIESR